LPLRSKTSRRRLATVRSVAAATTAQLVPGGEVFLPRSSRVKSAGHFACDLSCPSTLLYGNKRRAGIRGYPTGRDGQPRQDLARLSKPCGSPLLAMANWQGTRGTRRPAAWPVACCHQPADRGEFRVRRAGARGAENRFPSAAVTADFLSWKGGCGNPGSTYNS